MNDADSCRCDDMAARILRFCEAHDVKIVAAESLTGGLLAVGLLTVGLLTVGLLRSGHDVSCC